MISWDGIKPTINEGKTSGDSLWDCSHQKYQNMIWVCQKMVKLPSSCGEVDGGNDFLNHVILVFSVSLNFQTPS